jgi:hypothetical protein
VGDEDDKRCAMDGVARCEVEESGRLEVGDDDVDRVMDGWG